MGIFGALNTAVGGLRAQSFALENVSGNIANSQTTGYKRVDTSFQDLIPDQVPTKQLGGNVVANSRATNTVQGDIQASSISTFMAINGDGFFVIQKPSSFTDGRPVFDGINLYTRRGDFQPNKDGYLVNGAGYYLMGIPIDPTTGNLTGSVPQLLQFQNDFLPAQATTQVTYRANLASYPLTPSHDSDIPGTELLRAADFIANPLAIPPTAAQIIGYGATLNADAQALALGTVTGLTGATTLASLGLVVGDTISFYDGTNTTTHTVAAAEDIADVLATIAGGTAAVTGSLDASGRLRVISTNFLDTVTVSGTAAATLGFGVGNNTFLPVNLLTQGAVAQGQTLTVTVGANPTQTITFGTAGMPAEVATLADLQVALTGLANTTGNTVDATGNVTIKASSATDDIVLGGTVTSTNQIANFGVKTLSALPSNQVVIANDLTAFLNESIGGGAVTAYDVFGSPVNIQLRWAKTDSVTNGGVDTWNLFYQVNSIATGSQAAWRNVGTNFVFGANGQLNPAVTNLTLSNVTIDGISLGSVAMNFGAGGITQFADPNGTARVNQLAQNGFPAGSLQSVSVSDKGRLVGAYSNGRSLDLAEITLANFNGANYLKRVDGGAFEVTDESGPALLGGAGNIVSSSLEGSNTDIADEFTKLIVTQQAYSSNTRVITTSNQMVQDLLNVVR
ncbi:MAG: flagellar hook-basal body complex protein [Pseudolabrys sp.]